MKDEKNINEAPDESPKKSTGAKVRSKAEAEEEIRRELRAKMGADDAACEACGIAEALDELYDAYEKDGTVPTREAMADLIRQKDGSMAQAILFMKRDPFTVRGSRKLLAAGAALVGVAAVIGIAVGLSQPSAKEPAPATPVASESKADKKSEVTVRVEADGIDGEIAVPGGIAVTAKDDASSGGDESVFELAGPKVPCGEFAEGEYELAVTSAPILMDGGTYKVPDEPVEFAVAGDGGAVTVEVELEKLPVESMTKEQLEAVAAQMEASGFGEAAKPLHDKAEGAESKPGSEAQIEVAPPKPQENKPSGGNTSPNNGSTGGSKPSGGNSGGGSNGGGSKPSHTHSWVEQTTQQWVPNNVWVVDQAAWDEVVPGRTYVLCSCGATFDNDSAWGEHSKNAALNGDLNHSYTVKVENTTIHHEEIGHWEDRGYNQTIVTGYVCSGCGASR